MSLEKTTPAPPTDLMVEPFFSHGEDSPEDREYLAAPGLGKRMNTILGVRILAWHLKLCDHQFAKATEPLQASIPCLKSGICN